VQGPFLPAVLSSRLRIGVILLGPNLQLFQEEIFRDLNVSDKEWRLCLLRYFNPVRAPPDAAVRFPPLTSTRPTSTTSSRLRRAVVRFPALSLTLRAVSTRGLPWRTATACAV
jgi:hypothetical protein